MIFGSGDAPKVMVGNESLVFGAATAAVIAGDFVCGKEGGKIETGQARKHEDVFKFARRVHHPHEIPPPSNVANHHNAQLTEAKTKASEPSAKVGTDAW